MGSCWRFSVMLISITVDAAALSSVFNEASRCFVARHAFAFFLARPICVIFHEFSLNTSRRR